jgi:hypothetical protein
MLNHTVALRYKSIDHLPATTLTARDAKDFGDGDFPPSSSSSAGSDTWATWTGGWVVDLPKPVVLCEDCP